MKILLISSLLVVVVYGGLVKDLKVIIDTVNKSGAKWRAGHYFAENSTLSSLKKLLGSIDLPTRRVTSRPRYLIPDTTIPEQFDSRDHWPQCPSIKHIRDQGNCGSCWAVAAAGTFTDRLCIASNGTFTESLSQEELLSCCHECGYGCRGGYTKMAWEYFAEYGIVTGGDYQSKEGCQPYEIISCAHHVKDDGPPCDTIPEQETPKCQKNCSNPLYTKSFESDHHKVKSAYMIINDTKEIQKEIMAHGPVEASYVVYDDFFTYTSGIYHRLTGELQGKHAVKIIGWGVEADTPYWLVANQWRASWGEKGFFRILRGKDECGIESEVVAGIPELCRRLIKNRQNTKINKQTSSIIGSSGIDIFDRLID